MPEPDVVIVGGSIAGVRTAQSLRSYGHTGDVTIISDEVEPPYDRPPLSKALLAEDVAPEEVRLLSDAEMEKLGIRLVTGTRATRLQPCSRQLLLDGSVTMRYDELVIATGCSAAVPSWARCDGVHFLRTLADALRLREAIASARSLAIVGAGFVGCEVAAIARARRLEVSLVDPMAHPMWRALDEVTGAWFSRLHAEHGVAMMLGTGLRDLEARAGGFRVLLDGGTDLDADAVLVGVGARPNTAWLEESGLTVDDGVRCDPHGRALGVAHVYAVGDVARWDGTGNRGHERQEHWTNAVDQAQCVAHNILHPDEPRPNLAVPYVWTDQYDWKAQIVGIPAGANRIVLGDPFQGRAAALYGDDDGVATGGVIVNWPKAMVACRRGVGSGAPIGQLASTLESQGARRTP